ncbi:MAG TPA: hypothetical protein VMZ92_10275 [Planctomycetota bacterium]|nr:hypothetical protein [Planctomycetota bacterium]
MLAKCCSVAVFGIEAYAVKERVVETGADRLVIERALNLCR